MLEIRLICEGLSQTANIWVIAVIIGTSMIGKIVIFCVALRGASPAERPKIISALARIFRWWQRPGE